MVTETDLELGDGRTLHVYDTGTGATALTVFWHHGSPNVGAPPEPLLALSARLGLRWVSHDRPGYGGSSPHPGRSVASAAADVAAIADRLGIERFAAMGHSGGGPHALSCAALLPDRVLAAVCGASLAPYDDGPDWFAGMAAAGEAELRAATQGRAALEQHLATTEFDPDQFIPADHATLAGEWSWLETVVGEALKDGLGGLVDDDLAYVAPWGFAPAQATQPVLFLHGERDRIVPSSHSVLVSRQCPAAELWLRPDDGHISVLASAPAALQWLRDRA